MVLESPEKQLLEKYLALREGEFARAEAARAEVEAAERLAMKYSSLIEALVSVVPDGELSPDEHSVGVRGQSTVTSSIWQTRHAMAVPPPRGEAAVDLLLRTKPDVGLTAFELTRELAGHGWLGDEAADPVAATRAAANRLRKKRPEDFVFVEGRYAYVGDSPLPPLPDPPARWVDLEHEQDLNREILRELEEIAEYPGDSDGE